MEALVLAVSLYFLFKIKETYNKDIEDNMIEDTL